jgi:dephospho-CoA kinase
LARPFVIGVTGGIACGKSTVLRELGRLGAETIDADAVYHDLVAPGKPLVGVLAERFGPGVVAEDGSLDRRALGRIVFGDPAALAELDALTHPAVITEVRRRIEGSGSLVVAVDAVKLVESGMAGLCDRVWLVTCTPEQQVERLMARGGLTRDEAERRVAAQAPDGPRLARADLVIDNSGPVEATVEAVRAAWARLPQAVG